MPPALPERSLDPRAQVQGPVAHHSIKELRSGKAGGITSVGRCRGLMGLGFRGLIHVCHVSPPVSLSNDSR
jgi:hypothetical protein